MYLPVYGPKHPVNQWEIRHSVQKSYIRPPLQQQNDRIQRRLGPEVRPQRYNEIVDTIRSVVCGQDDGLILPLVVSGVPIATMFANLS